MADDDVCGVMMGPGANNPHHNAWYTTERVLSSELQACRSIDLSRERFWVVQSSHSKNRTGKVSSLGDRRASADAGGRDGLRILILTPMYRVVMCLAADGVQAGDQGPDRAPRPAQRRLPQVLQETSYVTVFIIHARAPRHSEVPGQGPPSKASRGDRLERMAPSLT
jgi:hypothetical protein